MNKDGFEKNYNGFIKDYNEYGFKNVSYRSLGREINSNFVDDETYMERQETLENLQKIAKIL